MPFHLQKSQFWHCMSQPHSSDNLGNIQFGRLHWKCSSAKVEFLLAAVSIWKKWINHILKLFQGWLFPFIFNFFQVHFQVTQLGVSWTYEKFKWRLGIDWFKYNTSFASCEYFAFVFILNKDPLNVGLLIFSVAFHNDYSMGSEIHNSSRNHYIL